MIALSLPDGPITVLLLGAHPDDIEIGCGGTLLQLERRAETTVHAVILSGSPQRRAEAEAAIPRFFRDAVAEVHDLPDGRMPSCWGDAKQTLEDVARRVRPQLIFAPRVDDAHQDHRLVGKLVGTVWRDALVFHYEIPKWDGDICAPTHYVAVDDASARRKVALLDLCYPSQVGRDWWDEELFLGFMRLRGVENRSRYAEAFVTTKVSIRFDHTEEGT